MRSGLDSATSTLYTGGAYDVHTRLKIENGSGTLISLENRYTKLSVRKPDPIEPIGSMQITLIRDSTISGVNQSLSPLVEGSDLNEDDAEDYSPLLQLGRLVTLDVNLTAVGGARPSDGDSTWYEIFRGIVGKVDWPDHDKGRITVQVDGLAAVLQHAKAESERTYLAGTSLETVVTQVLTNHGYSTIPTYFPAATSKVLPNDWAPGYQKTIWQQLTAIAQSMGWVVYYRYRGQNAPEITFFAPARTKTVADQTVEARDFKQLSLDDAEVRNVGFLVYVDEDSVEQLLGPDVNSASLTKYGGSLGVRRPFWIKLEENSPIRTETEAQAMLTAALSDVADPDVVASATTVPLLFTESGIDLYTIPAHNRFFDSNQKWALFSNKINFAVNTEPHSSIGLRGVPTAGSKSWRDLSIRPPTSVATHPKLRAVRVLHETPSADKITVNWNNNSKVYSVWAYLETLPQPIEEDDEPWPTGSCPPEQVLVGAETIVIDIPATGYVTFLQLEPRSLTGECGDPVRLSFDPPAVTVEIETPSWEITAESEGATDGTYTVKLYDPDAVMDDVYYRTKSGTAAWSSYGVQDASPTHLDTYTRTITMVESHPSFVEFRGRYTINGVQHPLIIKSSGFDLGQRPNIRVVLTINEAGVLSANVQGDSDTASIKILASKTGQPSDTDTRAVSAQDGRMFPSATIGSITLNPGETGYATAFGYSATSGGGDESSASVKARVINATVIAPTLEDVSQTEDGTNGTYTVKVLDPQSLATDLYYRTKSGHGDWSAWVQKTGSPSDDTSYNHTVTLLESHMSFIQFQLWYDIGAESFKIPVTSGGFDKGTIPNISMQVTINKDGVVSANVQGDIDTASIKIVASDSGQPSDSTTRAATAKNGRVFTTTNIGTLATIDLWDVAYVTCFGYSGANGTGDESSISIKGQVVRVGDIVPTIEDVSQTETATTGTYTVKILDPQSHATKLYWRSKSGTATWTSWTLIGDPPSHNTSYDEDVTLVEGHQSYIQFQLWYVINGNTVKVPVTSGGFDKGTIPNIALDITIAEDGVVSANVQGDVDTGSIKILASSSGQPSDADTRNETAKNGRMLTTADIGTLATIDIGDTVYVTAFGYSASSGGGTESSASVKTRKIHSGSPITPRLEEISQVESSTEGTFTVKVLDPAGIATDLYQRTKVGAAAWSSWTLKTATPANATSYAQVVTLAEEHQSFVQFQLWYKPDTSHALKTHIASGGFDAGTISNIAVSLTTDATGILSANVQGDVDTASIKILGSTSGQPSDGNTRLETAKNGRMFATNDIGTLATLDVGQVGYVTAFGYGLANGGGRESTESVKVRYTRPGEFKPEVFVKEVRAAAISTVTLDVEDTFLRVTAIEYKKRDGVAGGESIDGSWLTAWTSSTGTISSASTLQRVINIPVADGTEGELQWRVKYTDVNGNVQTFGDSFTVVNLAEVSGEIIVPWTTLQCEIGSQFGSPYQPYTLLYKKGYATGTDSGYALNHATVILPPGVTLTKLTQVGYREETTNYLIANFISNDFSGGSRVLVGTVINDTTGWQAKELTLSHVVSAAKVYTIDVQMYPANGTTTWDGDDVRLACWKLEYDRPAYSNTY